MENLNDSARGRYGASAGVTVDWRNSLFVSRAPCQGPPQIDFSKTSDFVRQAQGALDRDFGVA